MESHEPLPYWQINCPPQNRTVDCPPFLLGLNDKDKRIVSTPDEDFEIMTWEQVVPIIQDNRLAVFQRIPSQLRRYKAFSYELAKQYGSIASFILRERLQWSEPIVARGTPFECLDDYKILWNDWPYGLDKRIVHLVVWTKFDLQVDGKTGDLTPEARAQIDDFVGKTFRSRVPAENVRG